MTSATNPSTALTPFPDHTQLPEFDGTFVFAKRAEANERGHYPIGPLEVELGLWLGVYQNVELPWLRWWDLQGNLLLSGDERAEQERQRAEQESQRADRLAAQLRRRKAVSQRGLGGLPHERLAHPEGLSLDIARR